MKKIRIILEDEVDGEVYKAEKIITWHEYNHFSWSTMAEVLGLTISQLDEKLSEEMPEEEYRET